MYDDLMPAIIAAQESNAWVVDVPVKFADLAAADHPDIGVKGSQWIVIAGALTYAGKIYLPAVDPLRGNVISRFHDNLQSSHFGAVETPELVSKDFDWPAMHSHVCKYVSGYEVCHPIKALRQTRQGINMCLVTPSRPWEGITMDCIIDLPDLTASGYTGILVIMDQLTKMAIYLPCRNDIDSPKLAWLFFAHVMYKRGILGNIFTDCGTQSTSRFRTLGSSHLRTNHRLSSFFCPQRDGQTEHQNPMMEQYLPAFCKSEQDNWVELILPPELAYNHAVHASTRMARFLTKYHYHPVM